MLYHHYNFNLTSIGMHQKAMKTLEEQIEYLTYVKQDFEDCYERNCIVLVHPADECYTFFAGQAGRGKGPHKLKVSPGEFLRTINRVIRHLKERREIELMKTNPAEVQKNETETGLREGQKDQFPNDKNLIKPLPGGSAPEYLKIYLNEKGLNLHSTNQSQIAQEIARQCREEGYKTPQGKEYSPSTFRKAFSDLQKSERKK